MARGLAYDLNALIEGDERKRSLSLFGSKKRTLLWTDVGALHMARCAGKRCSICVVILHLTSYWTGLWASYLLRLPVKTLVCRTRVEQG